MKFSIMFLLGLTLCIALLIVTVPKARELLVRERMLQYHNFPKTDVSGLPLPSIEAVKQQVAVSRAILAEFGISPNSTRFRKDTSNSNTDPSIYFTDKSAQQLCRAISANRLDEIKRLLVRGADVDARGDGGITPLFWALAKNNREAFHLLLENKADPDLPIMDRINLYGTSSFEGDSLLMTCATCWFVPIHFLEDAIVHSRNANQRRANGDTLLMARIRTERIMRFSSTLLYTKTLELLIKSAVDLNAQNKAGETACMLARSQPQLCLWLIDQGADPLLQNADGKDLLDLLEPDIEFYSKSNRNGEGTPYFQLRDKVLKLKSGLQSKMSEPANATGEAK